MKPDPNELTWQRTYRRLNRKNRRKAFQYACELHSGTRESRLHFTASFVVFLLILTIALPRIPFSPIIILGGSLAFAINLQMAKLILQFIL